MSGGGFLGKLKALDAYPKINEDFFTKTMSGGIITIVSSVVMVLLFLSELRKLCCRACPLVSSLPVPYLLRLAVLQGYSSQRRQLTSYRWTWGEERR